MTRHALCVGINAYEVKPLNGCVNDATSWAELLVANFDFPRANVAVLTDGAATKRAMIGGLKRLLAGAASGDVLVFTNSSHGTQVLGGGDADETMDEAICPVDYLDGVLVDDELRELFTATPPDVHLTVVSDSCHSGSVTRAPGKPTYAAGYTVRARWLDAELVPAGLRPTVRAMTAPRQRYPEEGMHEILLAGCTDLESSYDAVLDGAYHGAMTYYAQQAIREAGYRLTYEQLAARIAALFAGTRFAAMQHPQLEGRQENKARQIFS
jgi:hypothetical protein